MEHARSPTTRTCRVDELLTLQQPRSDGPEHDEMLFIVIHQVYELWFKEILHELDHVRALLDANEAHRAQHTLKRILTILKVLVAQLDILETMTPLEFQSFRERGSNRPAASSRISSGSSSSCSAAAHGRRIERFPAGSRARAALAARLHEPTLWDAFFAYLAREGYPVPADALAADPAAPDRAVGRAAGRARARLQDRRRRTPRCASGSSISTRACRSGATAT